MLLSTPGAMVVPVPMNALAEYRNSNEGTNMQAELARLRAELELYRTLSLEHHTKQ